MLLWRRDPSSKQPQKTIEEWKLDSIRPCQREKEYNRVSRNRKSGWLRQADGGVPDKFENRSSLATGLLMLLMVVLPLLRQVSKSRPCCCGPRRWCRYRPVVLVVLAGGRGNPRTFESHCALSVDRSRWTNHWAGKWTTGGGGKSILFNLRQDILADYRCLRQSDTDDNQYKSWLMQTSIRLCTSIWLLYIYL